MSAETGSLHIIDYRHEGATYSLHVWARDWRDAEERLRSIQRTGKVIGSNATIIPANSLTLPFVHLWVKLSTWWRNR